MTTPPDTDTDAASARARVAVPVGLGAGCVAALVLGLLVTSAAASGAISDPGAVTRWGLPVARGISELAATLTIGLLVLAAFALPGSGWPADGGPSQRGRSDVSAQLAGSALTATRLAGAIGTVWVGASALVVVLSYAGLAGVAPGSPGFWAQLAAFVPELALLRALLFSTLLAAVATTGAAVATRHTTVGLLAVVALLALAPLALTGHAHSGTHGHELAVDSLMAHLVGVTVWMGGLAALVMLRRGLGAHLAAVAARYSTLALWCFVAVAVSGAINAYLRVGTLAALGTPYGTLVLVKIVALMLLGLAGWRHRRSLLRNLQDGGAASFWRLVSGELALMVLALGLGVALSASQPPVTDQPSAQLSLAQSLTGYPMPGPISALSWLTTWRFDLLWSTVVAVLAGGYLVGVVRMARRGDHWPILRTLPWLGGCLLLLWVTNGPTGVYGRVLFSAHMLSHMLLSMVVPALLVLGAPVTLALRTMTGRRDGSRGPREWLLAIVHSRLFTALSNPLVAAGIFAVSLVVFYYSPLFELSLRTHTGHALMNVHFLLAGYLFASVLIGIDPGPVRPPYPLRLLVLFATMAFHAFFGVALVQGTDLLAPDVLGALGRTWGRSPLADQQYGGAVAWGLGELPTMLLGMGVALAWMRSDDRETRRVDRTADRDGDLELAAYNARLAAMARDRTAQ